MKTAFIPIFVFFVFVGLLAVPILQAHWHQSSSSSSSSSSPSSAVSTVTLPIPPRVTLTVNGQSVVASLTSTFALSSYIMAGKTYYSLDVSIPFSQTATFFPTGPQPAFTLTGVMNVAGVRVYRDGLRMALGQDYQLAGSVVTFIGQQIPQNGDQVVIDY